MLYCAKICAALHRRLTAAAYTPLAVHSVFKGAINLCGQGGLLFALLPTRKALRPYTILVDGFESLDLSAGQSGGFQDNTLAIGRFSIPMSSASPVSLLLPEYYTLINRTALQKLYSLIAEAPRERQSALSLEVQSFIGETVSPAAPRQAPLRRLFLALKEASTDCFLSAAAPFCGLGEGLTPSGDDFLCGIFLVLHAFGRGGPPKAFVLSSAADGTNLISKSYLKSAAGGLAPLALRGLIEVIFSPGEEMQEAVLTRYFNESARFGATSGGDICTGVLFAAAALLPGFCPT